jgi:zeta-carotene desaturase
MPRAVVLGGGLAGLSAAAALAGAGFEIDVFEARPFPGGRATSFPLSPDSGAGHIDNCQHILLRCCVNLLDFYERIGVRDRIRFHRELYFLEPGGRRSIMRAGRLPSPFHFLGSFHKLSFLGAADKLAVVRGLGALRRERGRPDLDRITMSDWLREKNQTPGAVARFWRQVLVSAVNEELDRMAALHAFQVFRLAFLSRREYYEMGVPAVPLAQLYSADAWAGRENVRIHLRAPVERIAIEAGAVRGVLVDGEVRTADYYICALPFERVPVLAPELCLDVSAFEYSPITGIHLWFDRPVLDLPHATLLDRTIQWAFNKRDGQYVQLVVSASRSLTDMPRAAVIALAVRELGEFLPRVREARLENAHVVKEIRATFSARPGLEASRPEAVTRLPNLFLAGDWTRTGWPATMEGAVRSGYLAAEAVTRAAGCGRSFLLPEP